MSLPNRLQNANSSQHHSNIVKQPIPNSILYSTDLPVSLDTTEEEGQIYLEITKHVAKTITRYKISQLKQAFNAALHSNSQYNDEGF